MYILTYASVQDKALYDDDFGDSDTEKEPDAYLARVKAEAKERDSDSDDDESTDEDFNPDKAKESDVAEELVHTVIMLHCYCVPQHSMNMKIHTAGFD